MRINEVASAEEQLALWKLVSDNTWAAISQQAEAERRQRAEKAAQAKLKPKAGGKRGGRKSLPLPPRITPPPPLKKPQSPLTPPKLAQPLNVGAKQLQPKTANPLANNPQPPTAAQATKQQQTNPQVQQIQPNQLNQQPLTPQQMRLQRQNNAFIAKNSSVAKRM